MEWSRFMLTFCSCEHSLHKKTTVNPAESAAPLAQVLSLRSYILVFYFSITILYLSLQYSGFNNMPCIPSLQVSSVVLVHRCDYSLILSPSTNCFRTWSEVFFTRAFFDAWAVCPNEAFAIAFVGPSFTTYMLRYLFVCWLLKSAYIEKVNCVPFPVLFWQVAEYLEEIKQCLWSVCLTARPGRNRTVLKESVLIDYLTSGIFSSLLRLLVAWRPKKVEGALYSWNSLSRKL